MCNYVGYELDLSGPNSKEKEGKDKDGREGRGREGREHSYCLHF